jgi:hypothetical protein
LGLRGTGEWRTLHNEELYYQCFSPNTNGVNTPRRNLCPEHVGERRGVDRVLVETPEEKRALERSRHLWEDNINIFNN